MSRRPVAAATLLARVPLFRGLDAATLERLAAAAARQEFKRGDVVFRKDEPIKGMYVVVYGEIKLWGTTPKGGTRLSSIVGPGHSLAEPMVFLDRRAVVSAQAGSDALLLQIPKTAMFAELEGNAVFAREMVVELSRRIERLVLELERQAVSNGTERFIAYLLRNCADRSQAFTTTLPASKRAIASLLNLTPEHFSRILQELQQAQLLQVEGRRISVPVPERLLEAGARG